MEYINILGQFGANWELCKGVGVESENIYILREGDKYSGISTPAAINPIEKLIRENKQFVHKINPLNNLRVHNSGEEATEEQIEDYEIKFGNALNNLHASFSSVFKNTKEGGEAKVLKDEQTYSEFCWIKNLPPDKYLGMLKKQWYEETLDKRKEKQKNLGLHEGVIENVWIEEEENRVNVILTNTNKQFSPNQRGIYHSYLEFLQDRMDNLNNDKIYQSIKNPNQIPTATTKPSPKSFDELFRDKKYIDPCVDVLRKIKQPLVDVGLNYIGKSKSAFYVWLDEMQRQGYIFHCSEIVYIHLLNNKFSGLDIKSKDGSIFRKANPRAEDDYRLDFKTLLSQVSQLSLTGQKGK